MLELLHNPRYAGAFVFGRTRTHKVEGRARTTLLPREQWTALFPAAHEGYISWEEYEDNQRRLRENAQAHGGDRHACPPREGPALLQGLAICGRCGELMGINYHQRGARLVPDYICQSETIQQGRSPCQRVPGGALDQAIAELLVRSITPQALELALAVQAEVVERAAEADALRRQQVERARYEADLAQRRFLRVDPENRLVADVLEADWNAKLRRLAEVQDDAERQRQSARVLNEAERAAVLALASDVPRLWQDERTPDRERKRLVRLLIADVTLSKGAEITAQVRFTGGATTTLQIELPLPATKIRHTDEAIVREIDRLLEQYTDAEVAEQLNAAGWHSYDGKQFHRLIVRSIRQHHQLVDRYERLRQRGLLTRAEMAQRLSVTLQTIQRWRDLGLLRAEQANDKGEWLYHVPDTRLPAKWQHKQQAIAAQATS